MCLDCWTPRCSVNSVIDLFDLTHVCSVTRGCCTHSCMTNRRHVLALLLPEAAREVPRPHLPCACPCLPLTTSPVIKEVPLLCSPQPLTQPRSIPSQTHSVRCCRGCAQHTSLMPSLYYLQSSTLPRTQVLYVLSPGSSFHVCAYLPSSITLQALWYSCL